MSDHTCRCAELLEAVAALQAERDELQTLLRWAVQALEDPLEDIRSAAVPEIVRQVKRRGVTALSVPALCWLSRSLMLERPGQRFSVFAWGRASSGPNAGAAVLVGDRILEGRRAPDNRTKAVRPGWRWGIVRAEELDGWAAPGLEELAAWSTLPEELRAAARAAVP